MRILAVSTWLPYPPDNGSRVRAHRLLKHLAARHEVSLLSFGVPASDGDIAALRAFCTRVDVVAPTRLDGERLGLRGLLSDVPRHFVQTRSPRMAELVAAHACRHDVAIGLQVDAAQYLAGWPGLPRVFEEAEVGAYVDACVRGGTVLRRWRLRLTWWKFSRFVRGLVNSFDASTVVSAAERDRLIAIGCDDRRVTVVPNGTDAADSLPAPGSRSARLVYPGSVTYSANLEAVRYFVREIFPFVRRARPDATFVVTGSTDGANIGDLKREEGVTFTGRLPDIAPLLAESAACVVPLRTGGGTRLKVLQAMGIGTPVVSTPKGIEGLEVEPGRHVLVANSNADFAAQALRVMSEPALAAGLAERAHALVRARYGWDAIGDMLEDVARSAVTHWQTHAASTAER